MEHLSQLILAIVLFDVVVLLVGGAVFAGMIVVRGEMPKIGERLLPALGVLLVTSLVAAAILAVAKAVLA